MSRTTTPAQVTANKVVDAQNKILDAMTALDAARKEYDELKTNLSYHNVWESTCNLLGDEPNHNSGDIC